MPTLENDELVFRFPQIEENAKFSIEFQRTLRIPDSDQTYSLPPGLGSFPLRHVEDFAERLPASSASRGGVFLPMWQAEAMWLSFHNQGPNRGLDFPVAIKMAAGKINAVTGQSWRGGLHRDPQDYMVSPQQDWLDGFAIQPGVIRQFVAMPLGEGYTAEEQLTGNAEWGGIQISVTPLKAKVWQATRQAWEKAKQQRPAPVMYFLREAATASPAAPLGLAAGGQMQQAIYPDPFGIEDWDTASTERVFVTLVHAKDWKTITGEAAPNHPPTAQDYSEAGMPWFDYYEKDQAALPGSERLASLKSVAELFQQATGVILPNSQDVETGEPIQLAAGVKSPRPVRISNSWEE